MNLNTPCKLMWSAKSKHRPTKRVGKSKQTYTRWLWEKHNGPIPEGLFVCHGCDVGNCVNLDHLYLDTNTGNILDAWKKGRLNKLPPPKGDLHPRRKVNSNQVLQIRALAKSAIPTKILADRFGISVGQIQCIISRRSWKHI